MANLDYLGLIFCFTSQGEQNNHTAKWTSWGLTGFAW